MQATKQIKSKLFDVKLNATVNPKAYLATIFFEFDTNEKSLLNGLLNKYKYEKVSGVEFNPNNNIYSAILGDCCIVINVPQEKINQNIALLLSYLAKSECKGKGAAHISGKYDKMMKDIKNVKITISGKIKRYVAKIDVMSDKLSDALNKIVEKSRNEAKGKETRSIRTASVHDITDEAMMYLSVILGDIACKFTKSGGNLKITFFSEMDAAKFENVMNMKERIIYLTRAKNFLIQSGTIGSPSAKDKDGSAHKRKVSALMDSQNTLAYIYSNLRGFNYKFKNVDALKSIDNDALNIAIRGTINDE